MLRVSFACALAALGVVSGCDSEPSEPPQDVPPPQVEPGESRLVRLTQAQYGRSVRDVFGEAIVVPANLEPDRPVDGLLAIGATRTSISALGTERFENASYDIAAQAMEPGAARDALVPCEPAAVVDSACARQALTALGRRVWRRPLAEDEVTALVAIADEAAGELGDFYDGLEFGIAALLQSPRFLFRVELGEPDPAEPSRLRFTDYEMASRLSYFLWNTTPDDALLDAAERGELSTDAGLRAQAERLLASPRARDAVRNLFTDLYQLYRLDSLLKDPTVFTHMSPEVGPFAREETLRTIEALLIDEQADYRELFTTRRTFLNRKLASIYNVRAPARDGFGEAQWPADSPRAGILTHLSLLAGNSHPVASSATLRGKFVRQVVLCGRILPPPTDLNTALPEASSEAPTLRDRIAVHLENEFCASCHRDMDPIGLGFEQFDALGRFRTTENGAVIDPSGELDGESYADARELARVVREHPDLASCLVENIYRYANSRPEVGGETDLLAYLTERFTDRGHRLQGLLIDVVMSPGFRSAVPAADEANADEGGQ